MLVIVRCLRVENVDAAGCCSAYLNFNAERHVELHVEFEVKKGE